MHGPSDFGIVWRDTADDFATAFGLLLLAECSRNKNQYPKYDQQRGREDALH
jgi:hypothetical protein